MARAGDDQQDAAYPSHTLAGMQAASSGPDSHHPAHRYRMKSTDWRACRLRDRRGGKRSAGRGESGALERRTQPVADTRGMHRCADVVHSLLILSPPGGSYRHGVNGGSRATMPTLEPQTAHLRAGRAPEEEGERLLSWAFPLRLAGCQPRAGPPHPVRCPPSGNGSARSAQALPPLPRVTLRDNRGHGITPQPAQQPAVAYIHRAHA